MIILNGTKVGQKVITVIVYIRKKSTGKFTFKGIITVKEFHCYFVYKKGVSLVGVEKCWL